MKKSKDDNVNQFLDDLKDLDEVKYNIIQKMRGIVFEMYPDVTERMIYGGIMFTLEGDFGGLFASKNHVSFEFSNGYLFKDDEGILEGKGQYRRHLKIRALEDIEEKKVKYFVKQV